jgi:hypothetical protein
LRHNLLNFVKIFAVFVVRGKSGKFITSWNNTAYWFWQILA